MRPRIVCHMVSSIDGRLHPSRRFSPPAAGVDPARLQRHYDEVASNFHTQGWMVGRKTVQEMAKGKEQTVAVSGNATRDPFVGDRRDRDLAVDPHGRVHYGQDHVLGDHAVAVLSEHRTGRRS